MERKKIGEIQGRTIRRRLVCNPTIQYIIINLHTKYDYSSLHIFREIFDKKLHHSKYGKKENWTNTGKNKQEKAGSQSHDTILKRDPLVEPIKDFTSLCQDEGGVVTKNCESDLG